MAVETRTAVRARKLRVLPPDRPRAARPLDRLVLDGRRLDMQIGDRLLTATMDRAIDTSTLITLGLYNGDRAIFRGLLGQRVMTREARLELDGLGYIAAGFSKQADAATLTFEAEEIVTLKRDGKDKPLRVSRDTFTRAQFCASMIRAAGVPVLVLDEAVIQPVAGRKKLKAELAKARRQAAKSAKDRAKTSRTQARGITGPGLTVQGAPADAGQRRVIAGVLAECARQKCSTAVTVCAVCCVIQESGAGRNTGRTGNDDVGDFQQGRNWISLANIGDIAKETRAFLLGYQADVGGTDRVLGWKQHFGNLTQVPGGIEAATKLVQGSVGGYAQHEAEARKWVAAGAGIRPGSVSDAGEAPYIKDVTFDRRKGESTWKACTRILGEVHWVIFAREGVIVIASEPALMRGPSTRTLTEYTDGTENIDFDGARGLRVGELTATSVVGRYEIDPGEPVTIDGLPPVHEKWLISAVSQDLLSPTTPATISAKRPTQPSDEPSATVVTPTSSGSGGTFTGSDVGARLYAECKRISDAHPIYGHSTHGVPLASIRSGQEQDCSASTSLALYRAGLLPGHTIALVSGDFLSWGSAGQGKDFTVWVKPGIGDDGHVYIRFANGDEFNTAGHDGISGPRLGLSHYSTAGLVPRRWNGGA